MNDRELQDWLNKHGGEIGRKNIEKEWDNPDFISANETPGVLPKVKHNDGVTVTAADGATITLRRLPEDKRPIRSQSEMDQSLPDTRPAYERVAETPPKPVSATAASTVGQKTGNTRPKIVWGENGAANVLQMEEEYLRPGSPPEWRTREMTPPEKQAAIADREASYNAAQPGGRYETHAQAEARKDKDAADERSRAATAHAGRTIKSQTTEIKGGNEVTTTVYQYPDGREDPPVVTTKPAPKGSTPQPQRVGDKWVVWKPDDSAAGGSFVDVPGPKEPQKPFQGADKKWYTWDHTDPASPVAREVQGPPEARTNVPSQYVDFAPDINKPGWGLFDRQKQLQEGVNNGEITKEQYDELIKRDHAAATAEAGRVNTITTNAHTAYGLANNARKDAVNESATRFSQSETVNKAANQTLKDYSMGLPALGPGAASRVLQAQMLQQLGLAAAMGGLKTPAAVGIPPSIAPYLNMPVAGLGAAPNAYARTDPNGVLGVNAPTAGSVPQHGGLTPYGPGNPDPSLAPPALPSNPAAVGTTDNPLLLGPGGINQVMPPAVSGAMDAGARDEMMRSWGWDDETIADGHRVMSGGALG